VRDALLGIGARHREPLMLLWAELGGLEAAEQLEGSRGLPEPARALQRALWPFLAAYTQRDGGPPPAARDRAGGG
jgi:hypothetical protein